ncbi:hypothetical protein BDV95DRAFT_52681 [Massariosphaeria phaeospora]|uniref:DUF7730 domain-containing protein n=1 Tax=Massariosphaeria phaeospora TaxID=100035 RepID=A0A7C8MNA9_9PLEO|nr:hypothetical protein BDV95DRAFT_52681 [Massariosphaeria phaeospora]
MDSHLPVSSGASQAADKASGPTSSTPARYPKRKRVEVNYYSSGDGSDGMTDTDSESDSESESEAESVPVKRRRIRPVSNKPLPKRKIFPFLTLPAELRNRIYEECLPATTIEADDADAEPTIWLRAKQRSYRRGVEFMPTVTQNEIENGFNTRIRRGTGRGKSCWRGAKATPPRADNTTPPHSLNILAVCQQIYTEAAPMLYARRFVFTDPDALFAYATLLTPRTAAQLRHISLSNYSHSRSRKNRGFAAFAMLAAKGATQLLSLRIDCALGYFHTWSAWRRRGGIDRQQPVPKRVARKVFRDACVWLDAMGARGVEVLAVAEQNFESWMGQRIPNDGIGEEEWWERGQEMYRAELRKLMESGR